MNGATAVPCARMISPPKTSNINRIGVSQYFLRVRMNDHSSAKIDMMLPSYLDLSSELVLHLGFGLCRFPPDPIALLVRSPLERQEVLAAQPHDPSSRRDSRKEDDAHDQRADDLVQQPSQRQPHAVERAKQLCSHKSHNRERRRERQGPPARRLPMQKRPAGDDGEHRREHQAEAPIGTFRRGAALNCRFQDRRHGLPTVLAICNKDMHSEQQAPDLYSRQKWLLRLISGLTFDREINIEVNL